MMIDEEEQKRGGEREDRFQVHTIALESSELFLHIHTFSGWNCVPYIGYFLPSTVETKVLPSRSALVDKILNIFANAGVCER